MPLLHLLRRLVRHIVGDGVDGIADEGEYAENDKQDEQGGEFREGRHNDFVIGKQEVSFEAAKRARLKDSSSYVSGKDEGKEEGVV